MKRQSWISLRLGDLIYLHSEFQTPTSWQSIEMLILMNLKIG